MFRRSTLVLALAALASPAAAQVQSQTPPTITVMTRNVFLGADLAPAINAPRSPSDRRRRDGLERTAGTNFAERAIPLANEIKPSKADLVGLQEVALWRVQPPSDGGAKPISPLPGATPAHGRDRTSWRCCHELGSCYRVVVVQEEFDAELPVDADASVATGTGPLAGFGADLDARLTMRDVILVRGQQGEARQDAEGHFKRRYEPTSAGSRSRSTAAGCRSRRGSASASSASSTPTWRCSGIRRSARRRPRS